MFDIKAAIIMTLLHLCGWDIVVAIPTCYNALGRSIRIEAMQEHIIGEPKFDTDITWLPPVRDTDNEKPKKKGFFGNMFNSWR